MKTQYINYSKCKNSKNSILKGMLNRFINSELDDALTGKIPSSIFCVCNFEESANNQEFPLVKSLATREEMSLDTTKCVIIKYSSNKQRIYEWFKGEELAFYIFEFVKIQLPQYQKIQFELRIEKASSTEQNDIPLNPAQPIKSQCPGPRLFLNLIEKVDQKQ